GVHAADSGGGRGERGGGHGAPGGYGPAGDTPSSSGVTARRTRRPGLTRRRSGTGRAARHAHRVPVGAEATVVTGRTPGYAAVGHVPGGGKRVQEFLIDPFGRAGN